MDPHLRWLRHLVIARVAERLAIEAMVVGTGAAIGAWALGWGPADVMMTFVAVTLVAAVARLASSLMASPINHRYLLQWTDPSVRLRPSGRNEPLRAEDPVAEELIAGSFRFLTNLERCDDEHDGPADGQRPGLDLYRAEGGRLLATRGDADEITILSRLEDGRLVVTSAGFIPPTEQLLVQRAGDQAGQIATDALIAHVERLLVLRAAGIEAVASGVDDVIELAMAEWEAWQELGPFIGPLIEVEPGRRWSGPGGFALRIEIPDRLIRDRTDLLRRGGARAPRGARTRSRPASG